MELKFKDKIINVEIRSETEHIQKYWQLGVFYEIDMLNYIYENYGKGLNYVDVGANIGNHTLFFSQMMAAKKVYSFEPIPELFDHAAKNLKLNNIDNVIQFDNAIGNKKRKAKFLTSDFNINCGMSKIDILGTEDVQMNRLDNYEFEKIDILKIDIEDGNIPALRGAKKTILRDKPDIFIEAVEDIEKVTEVLESYGYNFSGKTFNRTPTHLFIAK